MLVTNTSLTELFLDDNQIGDTGARHIADGLMINSTLTSLSLGWNNISESECGYFESALQVNASLTRLDFTLSIPHCRTLYLERNSHNKRCRESTLQGMLWWLISHRL